MSEQITKLPDGSAFFTATIMSELEAMDLPPKERPICYRISSEMYHAVFEAVGEASMCWRPRPSQEVFESEQASDVAVRLCFKIAGELESRLPRWDTRKLADFLVAHGLVDRSAVEDPEGYDNGRTMHLIAQAAEDLCVPETIHVTQRMDREKFLACKPKKELGW